MLTQKAWFTHPTWSYETNPKTILDQAMYSDNYYLRSSKSRLTIKYS